MGRWTNHTPQTAAERAANVRASQLAWAKKNRAKCNAVIKRIESTPQGKENKRERFRAYRARKMGAAGDHFTQRQFKELCGFYGSRCLCCGRPNIKLTADHVIPLSVGGSDAIENIQPLCIECNVKKGVATIDYRVKVT